MSGKLEKGPRLESGSFPAGGFVLRLEHFMEVTAEADRASAKAAQSSREMPCSPSMSMAAHSS